MRALCAEVPPGADADPAFEDDPDERRRSAELAVEALSKAIDAGFRDLNLIRTDADLKSIRDREDVRSLIAGLEATVKAEEVTRGPAGSAEKLKANAALVVHRQRMAAADVGNARLKRDLAVSKHAVGLIQVEQGKVEEADRSFREEMTIREALVGADPNAVTLRADLAMARISLGEIAWNQGRLAEGAKAREAGLEAMKALALGQPEEAAARRHREGAEQALGGDYAQLGLWDEAARYRINSPGTFDYHMFAAAALMRITRPAEEYRRFTAEILSRPRPDGSELEFLRSVLFADSSADPALVLQVAQRREKLAAWEIWWLKYNLGMAYYRAGEFAKAVEALPEGAPHESILGALAMAHHRLGHADLAGRLFREAEVRHDRQLEASLLDATQWVSPWWHDVACYEALRREAGELIKGSAPAPSPFLNIHRGRAYFRLGEGAKAETEFAKAVAARPDDPSVWLARGRTFVQVGLEDRARGDFARAEHLTADGPRPWVLQGRFLAERGRRAEAEAAYMRAAELAKGGVTPFLDAGWWAVGPYPKDSDLSQVCPPEVDPDPATKVAAVSGPEDLRWRHLPVEDYGKVDLGGPFGTSAQSAYAMTYVYSADDRAATFLVGGDDSLRLWVNGRPVHDDLRAYLDHKNPGMLAPVAVRLRKGRNVLLAKVSNEMFDFWFFLRPAEGSFERGLDFARVGLWGEAADQIRAVRDHGPSVRPAADRPPPGDLSQQRNLALLLLLSDDEDGFRAHARWLVAMYGASTDPSEANTLCYAWLFSDQPAPDGDRLVRLMESAYERLGRADHLLFELGVARYRAGKFEDAIRTIEESTTLRAWSRSWPLLALAHHRLGHDDESRSWLARATAWYDSQTRVADAFPRDDWWDRAQFELLYREAMRSTEGAGWTDRNREGLQSLARERVKGFDPATVDLDLAIMSRPGQPQLHLARASILADLDRDRDAEADLDRAVKLTPRDAVVWKRRALIHARMGRPDEAAEDILAARRAVPAINEWWKPEALGVIKEMVRLDDVFAELVRHDPTWHGYWDARLFERGSVGRWGEAEGDSALAIDLGPKDPIFWSRMASLQAGNGNRRGYREACGEILARHGPADDQDRYRVREDAVACLLLPDAVGDLGPVRRLADLGLKMSDVRASDHYTFLVIRALFDYRAGDPGRAAERLEAIALDGDDTWTHLGRITLALSRSRLGREAEARRGLHLASESLRRSRPRLDRGQRYPYWQDWVAPEVLLREAEELILDPGFPSAPFAHEGNKRRP